MTVKELYDLCKKEIENGNGDRNIVLCVKLEDWEEEEDNVIVLN